MPWPEKHKEKTRARIVAAAAAAFRARGVSRVGVADIMKRAGLTHGGFYAHFSSKEDLLVQALERAAGETRESLSAGSLDALSPDERLSAIIDRYLSPNHAAHPECGCPIAALGSELTRSGRKASRELTRLIRSRLEWVRTLSAGRTPPLTEEELTGTLACMVGGVVLARGLGDGPEGNKFLEMCRVFVHRALSRALTPHATDRAR